MSEWKIITEFTVKGARSLTEADLNIRISPGDGPAPGFLTVDIYPEIDARYPSRHLGTWQFPFDDIADCDNLVLSVDTNGVRLAGAGAARTPCSVINGKLREDGSYAVYLVLMKAGNYEKMYETSYHRLLSFSGEELSPEEHWPGIMRRCPQTWQQEYWMMEKLNEAIREFIDELPHGANVLDYGGGCCPYYPFFAGRDLTYTNADIYRGQFVDIIFENDTPLPMDDESCDAVLLSHILEHTHHPYKVVDDVHRLLKKGGRILAGIPFAWENHTRPHDYWRIGLDGLHNIFAAFRDVEIRSDSNSAQALIMLKNGLTYRSVKNKLIRNALIRWGNFRYKTAAARCKDRELTCNWIVTAQK